MTSMRGMPCVDHLVVAADSLAEGAEWVTDRLGVPTEPGGEHPAFGTHNPGASRSRSKQKNQLRRIDIS